MPAAIRNCVQKCNGNLTNPDIDTLIAAHHSMRMRKLALGVLPIILAFMCADALAEMRIAEPGPKEILSMVPGAGDLKHISDPLDCYRLFSAAGRPVGVAFITTQIPPEIGGYRDEIAVLVGVNESGAITGVKLLAHEESPDLMDKIVSGGFLKRFLNKRPSDNWDKIETITGATISSAAMKEDIRAALAEVVEKVIKSGVMSEPAQKKSIMGFFLMDRAALNAGVIAVLIALSVLAVLMPQKKILRSSCLVLSFITIGVLLNTPVTIGNFIDLARGVLPPLSNMALLLLFAFAIVSAFVKGPVYCSYLCPFGAIQDGASGIRLPKCKISDSWIKSAAVFRWIMLVTAVVAVAGFQNGAFRNIEPFARCFAPDAGGAVLIQAATIIVIALFLRRPWCRLFCPTGLLIELSSIVGAKLRRKIRAHEIPAP